MAEWFQSTRPRGARRRPTQLAQAICCFNPRARGGRDRCRYSRRGKIRCFNPRARGGRDGDYGGGVAFIIVSIHAPAGGATGTRKHELMAEWFQSTRPRGARRRPTQLAQAICCFNPRARGGRDPKDNNVAPASYVSIHAPAGGATSTFKSKTLKKMFQSTRPRGARRVPRVICHAHDIVSIHAPAGGATAPRHRLVAVVRVSIHAPAGGATS